MVQPSLDLANLTTHSESSDNAECDANAGAKMRGSVGIAEKGTITDFLGQTRQHFIPVTIPILKSAGTQHFCWLPPGSIVGEKKEKVLAWGSMELALFFFGD